VPPAPPGASSPHPSASRRPSAVPIPSPSHSVSDCIPKISSCIPIPPSPAASPQDWAMVRSTQRPPIPLRLAHPPTPAVSLPIAARRVTQVVVPVRASWQWFRLYATPCQCCSNTWSEAQRHVHPFGQTLVHGGDPGRHGTNLHLVEIVSLRLGLGVGAITLD